MTAWSCNVYVYKFGGKNYLVDPFIDLNPGFPQQLDNKDFYHSIDCVFLTHGHFDHTSGLSKIVENKPDIMVVAQYDLAMILLQKGIKNVLPINLGGSVSFEDLNVTMVQAKHTSSYGEIEGTPIYAGAASGYIFDFDNDYTVYHSGDTALMYDMKLIQDVYNPEIAILSSSGHFTMGPKEAAYAVKHLLEVQYVIPSHTFPSKKSATSPETLDQLLNAFPVVAYMIDRDKDLKELLNDYPQTEVVTMGYGEEREFKK
ncbi:metal-dependent hydrolase [Neobacillus notoginsengisoli]|uniref:Metal-dependent hydrolase n=1 Tax=Neobacillus notoginsengisoli TaxID=1578198 RepID=A0A417YZZ6_9BACI|nr:metal-dependent hydrolase [Neobacillus notoginsengisoli]RHW43457.1 metal-dependent hydrolase [Neobacillus notoginsengisoli]